MAVSRPARLAHRHLTQWEFASLVTSLRHTLVALTAPAREMLWRRLASSQVASYTKLLAECVYCRSTALWDFGKRNWRCCVLTWDLHWSVSWWRNGEGSAERGSCEILIVVGEKLVFRARSQRCDSATCSLGLLNLLLWLVVPSAGHLSTRVCRLDWGAGEVVWGDEEFPRLIIQHGRWRCGWRREVTGVHSHMGSGCR